MERKGGSQYKLASPCMFRLPLPPSDEVSQRTALCSFLAALFFFKNCKLLLFSLFCFLIFALVLSRLCVFLLVAPFAVLAPSPKVCNNSAIETCKERRGCVPSCSNGVLHSKRSTEYGNNHAAKRIRHWSPSKEDSIVDVAFRPPLVWRARDLCTLKHCISESLLLSSIQRDTLSPETKRKGNNRMRRERIDSLMSRGERRMAKDERDRDREKETAMKQKKEMRWSFAKTFCKLSKYTARHGTKKWTRGPSPCAACFICFLPLSLSTLFFPSSILNSF